MTTPTDYYHGSVGPLVYDADGIYPDGAPLLALRGPQVYLERQAIRDYEAVTLGQMQGSIFGMLASYDDLHVTTGGVRTLYTVEADEVLIVIAYVLRVTSFTAGSKTQQAIISTGANSPNYNDFNTVTATFTKNNVRSLRGISITTELPIYVEGDVFSINVTTPSDADVEIWSVDLFGYLRSA